MPDGYLPGIADEEVEPNDHNDIDRGHIEHHQVIVVPEKGRNREDEDGVKDQDYFILIFHHDPIPQRSQTLLNFSPPRMPLGLKKRTISRTKKARASLYSEEMKPAPS